MYRKLLLLFFFVFVGQILLAQNFSGAMKVGSTGADLGRVTATDAQNNFYTLLYYVGTLTIDSAGTPKTLANFGNKDIAIVKYNCSRVFQWAIRIGGVNNEGGNYNFGGIKVDTSGNVYVSSTYSTSANFVSANGTTITRAAIGQSDAFVMKANSSGVVQWINLIGSNGGNDEGGGLAIDRNQNVYVTGIFFNNATVQSIGSPSGNVNSFGSGDAFIVKYNPSGSLQYESRVGGFLLDYGGFIDVDSTGAAYVSGGFGCCGNSFVNFGGNNLSNSGNWGGYLTKFDPTGNNLWGIGLGTNNGESLQGVVVDDINDKVYVTGHFQGSSTLSSRPPGSAIGITAPNSSYNALLACTNLNGSLQWVRQFGGTGDEYGFGVELDLNRNPMVTGEFSSVTNFGGGNITPNGSANAYFARYTPTNTFIEAEKFGNGSFSSGNQLHMSPTGLLYLTGTYNGQLIPGADTLNSVGNSDPMVLYRQLSDTTLISATNTNLLCTGDTSILVVSNKKQGRFVWTRNDTLLSESNGNMIKTTLPGTYKVISTNNCAPNDTSVSIVVNRSIFYVAPTVSDITICSGDSGRFNVTGASLYRWTPAAGLSDTTVANPFVKVTAPTTYYVIRAENGCFDVDTVTVSVQTNCCLTCASPYQLNNGVVACYPFTGNANDESGNGNDAAVFNATLTQDRFNVNNRAYNFNGFNSYLEVPNSPSLQSPGANMTFTFWARVSNWNFGGGVQFNPVISKSTQAGSAQYRAMIRSNGAYSMVNGSSFNSVIGSTTNINTWYFFTIAVSNDTLYYYRNGVLLGSATGPVAYTLNNTTPLRIGRNDVNSTSLFNGRLDEIRIYGRTLSAAEVLAMYNLSNINGLPTITAGADKNICKGDSVRLVTTGSNGTYLWSPTYALSSDTARSPYSEPDSTVDYIVRVDVSGCRNYDTVKVNVTNFIPDIGSDRSICLGDTATLMVANGGNTFAWSPNYRITSTTNDTTKVFPLIDTNYVVVSNNGLCSRSDTVRITVITPTINAGPDQNVCKDDTAYFYATSNGTVTWSPATYLSGTTGLNVYSVPDSSITYYATANYLGCVNKDTLIVSVATLPIDAGPNQSICLGDSVQLAATGGVNYVWLPSYRISDTSAANPWVKPLIPTYYYVVSYNALCSRYDSVFVDVKQAQANAGPDATICNGDSVQFNASALGTHYWSPTAGLKDTTLKTYAKPTTTTNYVLNVNNFGCSATDTVRVTVVNFNINAGSNKNICKGDSVQLQASGGTKYNWLPLYNISDTGVANPWVKPLGPTNYILLSSNGFCLRIDTVFVDVKSFSATAGKDTSVCEGLFVGLNASGGVNYQWMPNSFISDLYIPNPIVTPPSDTYFVVKINDGGICNIYDTVFVDVNKYPTVNAGPDFKHCIGESVTLLGSLSDYTRFEWSPAAGLNDKMLLQPQSTVIVPTTFRLNAWNGYCYQRDDIFVNVNPQIEAKFTADPTLGLAPLSVNFYNSSTNANFYTWNFGDLSGGSTDKDPTHIFTDEGVFTVQLIAFDSLGCADTTTTIITSIVNETLFMPNAFTPNGDGLNDFFVPNFNVNRFEFLEMSIYNRWGVKVFDTKVPGGLWWDGKINGTPEPPGIFTYYVVAKDKKGKSYEMNGTVTLVR